MIVALFLPTHSFSQTLREEELAYVLYTVDALAVAFADAVSLLRVVFNLLFEQVPA